MGTWGQGTRLVFERGVLEQLRSRSFRIVTGLLVLLSAASVLLPQLLADDTKTYTLATVGQAPPGVRAALAATGESAGFNVAYTTRENAGQLREAVRDRDATVALTGNTLYAAAEDAGTFPAAVAQAVVAVQTSRALADAGLSPQQLAQLQTIRPPRQVAVGAALNEGRAVLGTAVGMVLCLALLFAGTAIATAVALEKSTRISEVMLTVLRPSQILVGTVLSIGTIVVLQLLVLGVPFAVAVRVTDSIDVPSVAAGDVGLATIWFVLGFALYAFLYAATGALVEKVTEVETAVYPIAITIFGSYFGAFLIVADDPQGLWSRLASMFPITAPLAMPMRWAFGEVPVHELLIAMALTAATAVVMVALASTIYRRALVITGHRVRLREVLGRAG